MTDHQSSQHAPGIQIRLVADLLVLSRPVAALCAGATLFVGAYLSGASGQPMIGDGALLREGIAILLITAAVNVVNDIKDVRADAISRPGRPLPAGRLSASVAWRLAIVQGLAALTLSMAVPLGPWMTLTLLLAGVGYSYVLKGTVLVGNLVVALLAATPIAYGGYLGGSRPAQVLLASMIIFVFMFAFEVLKTIRDVVADSEAGYSTVATEWGTRATSLTFRISLAGYAALTLVPIAFGASAYYTALMWLGAVIPSCIVAWRCPIQNSPRAVRRVLLVMTICWIPGLAALSVAFRG